jgi:hypothetical protein
MRTYEPDVARSERIVDRNDQPVLVPFDIENDPVLADDAGVRIDTLDVHGRVPVSLTGIVVPRAQRLLGVGVLLPELSKRTESDDPHCG